MQPAALRWYRNLSQRAGPGPTSLQQVHWAMGMLVLDCKGIYAPKLSFRLMAASILDKVSSTNPVHVTQRVVNLTTEVH